MTHVLAYATAFAALLAAAIQAQPTYESYLITANYSVQSFVAVVDQDGQVLSTFSVLPDMYPYSVAHAGDHEGVLVCGPLVGSLPQTHAVILAQDQQAPQVLAQAETDEWIVETGFEQEYFVVVRWPAQHVMRLHRSQLLHACPIASGTRFRHSGIYDPLNGLIFARAESSSYSDVYAWLDPATGAVTSLSASPWDGDLVCRRPAYSVETGGQFLEGYRSRNATPSAAILLVGRSGSITTLASIVELVTIRGIVRTSDRRLPARYCAYVTTSTKGHQLWDVGMDGIVLRTRQVVGFKESLDLSGFLRNGGSPVNQQRDVTPNDRRITIAFPREAGRVYVAVLSFAAGTGLRLPDGRVVPVIIDQLTMWSLLGGAPGLIEGTLGVLDSRGRAHVDIKAHQLGAAVRGLVLFAAVAVLDSTAPSGLAEIEGPVRIAFE